MSEGAQFSKFTAFNLIWPVFTEFAFILLRMIKLFDSVVCMWTEIPSRTLFTVMLTWLRRIMPELTSSILFVVIRTLFHIVSARNLTRLCFKCIQIQESNSTRIVLTFGSFFLIDVNLIAFKVFYFRFDFLIFDNFFLIYCTA